jgi:hypothetical protein
MGSICDELASLPTTQVAPWAANIVTHSSNARLVDDLRLIEEYKPELVITALGSPRPVIEVVKGYGGKVIADVVNLKLARKAAAAGVDGMACVSAGAGGHTGRERPLRGCAPQLARQWTGPRQPGTPDRPEDYTAGDDALRRWKDIWAAGQGLHAIGAIEPVAAIVDRIEQEFRQAMRRAAGRVRARPHVVGDTAAAYASSTDRWMPIRHIDTSTQTRWAGASFTALRFQSAVGHRAEELFGGLANPRGKDVAHMASVVPVQLATPPLV